MVGDNTYTYAVANHEHEARGTELVRKVLGMAREVEVGNLDVALVDGRGDKHVYLAGFEVGA